MAIQNGSFAALLTPEWKRIWRICNEIDCARCGKPLPADKSGCETMIDAGGIWPVHVGCTNPFDPPARA